MPPRVLDVERAWLQAARNGDVGRMKMLRDQHPECLDLNRKINDISENSMTSGISEEPRSPRTSVFCSWDGFHLETIGASTLHTATWHGDKKIMEYLMQEGQDPDCVDDTGMTAAMLAIMHHNLQATRCIFRDRVAIQRNLLVDCREEDAERVQSTLGRIQLLLRFHADPNKRCRSGKAALHHAATDETYAVAKLLLDHGAEIDAKDEEGRSPLHHCIQSSSLQVADLLMQHGAQLHLPDNDGVTPLQLVIRSEDVNMLQVMLNHHQLVPTHHGEDFAGSVLMIAVDQGALSVVEFLLEERYVEAGYQNLNGETAMHRALVKQQPEVMELLCAVDERYELLALSTATGDSCFHYAACYSSPDELHCLLAFYRRWHQQRSLSIDEGEGATLVLLNNVNSTGYTALLLAATSTIDSLDDRNMKARLLLDAGAKLLGTSPLVEVALNQAPSSSSTMAFSAEVQRCLSLWLSECAETSSEGVARFCIKFLAIISSFGYAELEVDDEVLGILLSSGYTVDALPLLLLLPFDRRASLVLLEHVGLFCRQQNHPLLLALYEELVAAWTELN